MQSNKNSFANPQTTTQNGPLWDDTQELDGLMLLYKTASLMLLRVVGGGWLVVRQASERAVHKTAAIAPLASTKTHTL